MGGYLKGCGCRRCRSGMHTKNGGKLLKKIVRGARRVSKQMLLKGKEPPTSISRGYTD